MRSVSSRALCLVVVSLVTAFVLPLEGRQPQQRPSQPQATFRGRIEYVEVDAVARDKAGRFVGDLKKDDFEVLEDGKRQEIANVQIVDVPAEPQPMPALLTGRRFEPDVVSNTREPGRVYLVVLDDLHVSPMRTIAARKLARNFIEESMAANDVAAVVTTSGNRLNSQEFTSNKRLLLDAVDRFSGRKIMSPAFADILAGGNPGSGSKADEAQRIFNARTTLETLSYLATFAGNIHNRRKAIVMVGEGVDYDLGKNDQITGVREVQGDQEPTGGSMQDNGVPRRELRDRLREFVNAANRANVTLYAFDPTVYTQGGDDLVDIPSLPGGDYDKFGQENLQGPRLQDDLIAAQDNLRTLSTETGGFAVTGSLKAAANAFQRVRDENSHYYLLGYYPTNDKRDGKFRKIEVRVKRPGVEVQARRGYVAPTTEKVNPAAVEAKQGTSPELREALSSVLPTPGLPISVVATPFRGSNGNASVLVMLQTPPGKVKFVQNGAKIEGKMELSFVAVDNLGKARGGEHLDVAMPLKPETQSVVNRTGLLVQSRITLPPGRYVLRVGARDVTSDSVGSVHCDLEIPDYSKLPLSMSGILISSAETLLANPRPDPDIQRIASVLPGSPAVLRDFRASDTLGVLAEVYDTKLSTPHDIDIVVTATSEDGQEAYRHSEKRSTADLQGVQGGFGYMVKVPLAGFRPGSYLLRVEATSRLEVNKPVARETAFRVVAK